MYLLARTPGNNNEYRYREKASNIREVAITDEVDTIYGTEGRGFESLQPHHLPCAPFGVRSLSFKAIVSGVLNSIGSETSFCVP